MFVGSCNSSLFLLILQLLPLWVTQFPEVNCISFPFSMNVFLPLFRLLRFSPFTNLETFWLALGISSFFVKGKSEGPLLLQFFAKFVYSTQQGFIRSFNEGKKA
jgi:hypothetical protein